MHLHVDLGFDFVESVATAGANSSQSSVPFLAEQAGFNHYKMYKLYRFGELV